MTSRNQRYRERRMAAGAKPMFFLFSPEAASALDARCKKSSLSRLQEIEQWLLSDLSEKEG
jgi:hypothetical protein